SPRNGAVTRRRAARQAASLPTAAGRCDLTWRLKAVVPIASVCSELCRQVCQLRIRPASYAPAPAGLVESATRRERASPPHGTSRCAWCVVLRRLASRSLRYDLGAVLELAELVGCAGTAGTWCCTVILVCRFA